MTAFKPDETPAEWPPRPGDLWKDSYPRGGFYPQHRGLWFAIASQSSRTGIEFVGLTGTHDDPDRARRAYGPLTLVHREGAES